MSNDYKTKLNLTIADGNLPDVFSVSSQQLQQLIDADLIWDLGEIFDTYASDNLKKYMEMETDTLRPVSEMEIIWYPAADIWNY